MQRSNFATPLAHRSIDCPLHCGSRPNSGGTDCFLRPERVCLALRESSAFIHSGHNATLLSRSQRNLSVPNSSSSPLMFRRRSACGRQTKPVKLVFCSEIQDAVSDLPPSPPSLPLPSPSLPPPFPPPPPLPHTHELISHQKRKDIFNANDEGLKLTFSFSGLFCSENVSPLHGNSGHHLSTCRDGNQPRSTAVMRCRDNEDSTSYCAPWSADTRGGGSRRLVTSSAVLLRLQIRIAG